MAARKPSYQQNIAKPSPTLKGGHSGFVQPAKKTGQNPMSPGKGPTCPTYIVDKRG